MDNKNLIFSCFLIIKKFARGILKKLHHPFLRGIFAYGLLTIIVTGGCGGGGGSTSQSTYMAESGVAQKGPLIKASTVTAQELDSKLSPTGKQYTYQVTSDLGTFVPTSPFSSQYVGLYATGYYYDEVVNAVSAGPVTLNGYSDLTASSALNVNLLTTLAYQRIQHLVTISGLTFSEAEMQAEDEILAALNIPAGSYGNFGTLDLAGGTDGDHLLAAVSSLFISASGTPGNLSSLVADFQSDLAANGRITDAATKAALDRGAQVMDSAAIAENLTHKYSSVGVSFTASDIENWIDRDGDGVISKFDFRVHNATGTSLFTFPDFVVEQAAGTSISTTTGQLRVNGSSVAASTPVAVGDVVSVSPGGVTFPSGVLDIYLLSGTTKLARVQFISELVSLAVTPAEASVAIGLFRQFAAIGTFTDTSIVDVTSIAAWTSGTPAVATIAFSSGLAHAVSEGSTVITATIETVVGTATLAVTPAVIQSISVDMDPSPLLVGYFKQLTAYGHYSDSSSADVTGIAQWTSSDPSVATVGPTTGLVQAKSPGSATIMATIGSISGSAAVTARAVEVSSIAVTPNPAYAGIGTILQFAATGTFNDGTTADVTTAASWTSAAPAVATVGSATGLATGQAVGSSVISATIGSVSGTSSLAILANEWSQTASPSIDRLAFTATLLADGRVLFVGGERFVTPGMTLVELFDPVRQVFALAPRLLTGRESHTATLLSDGKVLVAGGSDQAMKPLSTVEVFDPVANAWSYTGNLITGRRSHTATRLPNGKVLVAGGVDSAGAILQITELYDPVAMTWSVAADMLVPRAGHKAILLPTVNKMLIVGGSTIVAGDTGVAASTAELYDPATDTWSQVVSPSIGPYIHTATLLSDGRVLVTGGTEMLDEPDSAELYDPIADAWSPAGNLQNRRLNYSATLLPDGNVLVSGGQTSRGQVSPTASVEVYDPVANAWAQAASMSVARSWHTATLLQNGTVLAACGNTNAANYNPASAELYWFH
jgi:N-acetylneuraminic acid mutarotase